MKNRDISFAIIAAAFIIVIGSIGVSFAAGTLPGTADDPVVTRSYVDKAIASAGGSIGISPGWEVVEVAAGQSVIGGQGTEIILRSGKAVAVDNGVNGISDLTNAKDLMGGTRIIANSLILIPRDDGRGIRCEENSFVMVLGSYEIK